MTSKDPSSKLPYRSIIRAQTSTFNTEMWKKYVNRKYSDVHVKNGVFRVFEIVSVTNVHHITANYYTIYFLS